MENCDLPFAITPFFDVRILLCVVINCHVRELPTVSAHKTNELLQATSQGQFYLLSYSDVKKAKGNDLPVRL